jgi:hypothetical protein|tara:strand:+ start:426 stop:776 length:351 start_codon:yes stop_codon:yes gene_type:complete
MIYFILTGLLGGFFSGFMGIGGGLIMVPFLVFFAKFNQHLAQGTSLAVLTLPVVIIGAMNYYQSGNVDIKAALAIAVFFCVGIYFGSKIAQTVSADTLKIFFGLFMVLVGIKLVIS